VNASEMEACDDQDEHAPEQNADCRIHERLSHLSDSLTNKQHSGTPASRASRRLLPDRWGHASGPIHAHLRKHECRSRQAQAHSRACRHKRDAPSDAAPEGPARRSA
jgi:hypothetical protein